MSNPLEPPFNELEERYLLAEILKHSNLPSAILLQFIREQAIEPAWYHIALPFGRSVSACQNAFHSLAQRTQATPPSYLQSDPKPRRPKRPLSTGDPNTITERILQPRPVTFATVNGPGQISPAADDGKPRKKRGRPSKEEHDRRVAEAEARGEVYPKPRKPKTPRPSMEGQGVETVEVVGGGAPTAVMFTPNKTILAPPTSPGSSRQKEFPHTTTIESTALPAGQVSHEEQRVAEHALAGLHESVLGPREDPSKGLRQLAAMPENRDIEMGQSEIVPSPGPAPVRTGYGPMQGHSYPGYQTHESPSQHTRTHEPQRHEMHQQHSQPQQAYMQETSAQETQKALTAEEQRQENMTGASGNVS